MNSSIFLATLFISITSNMRISFLENLRLKKEQPLKVAFMFGKVIPSEYEALPFNPLVQRRILFSYMLFYGIPFVELIYNNWWSAILVFVLGRIVGSAITRVFIAERWYWSLTYFSSIIAFILLVITLVKNSNQL